MSKMECLGTGLVYRNPIPHIYSRHAYFPSVVRLPGGEMVAAFNIGQAFESADMRTYVARSVNDGETWTLEGLLYPGTTDRVTSDCCRISLAENGEIIAFVIRHDRSRPDTGFSNPENLGFVEVELMLMRSCDGGHTWSGPEVFDPPLEGPSFEMNCPIIHLRDGRWIIPTSTWKGWDGYYPNGKRMVALVSGDKGRTWPEYMDAMVDPNNEIYYWESKIMQLPDGRLLALAWGYNDREKVDLPNQYALSDVKGKKFFPPKSTGLSGQTATPLLLDDGRILTVYRRTDKSGLWANISRIKGDDWINEDELPLWGARTGSLVSTDENMAENFHRLRFGAPCMLNMGNGIIYVAFWAVEDCVSNIRWYRLKIG